MNQEQTQLTPLIKAGWVRALIFCIIFLLLVYLGYRYLPLLATSAGLSNVQTAPGEPDPLLWLKVLGMMVLSVTLVFAFRKWIDRKTLASLGLARADYSSSIPGLLLPVAFLGTASLILYFTKHLIWTDITFSGNDLFIELGLMAMIAFYEELVFRGYILGNLLDSFPRWPALIISALLFALFHYGNPGISILAVINLFLAGILLGLNYVYTRDLWFAILFHFGWNFFQGPILGFAVSGFDFQTLLQVEWKGPELITGGSFGFEGSIVDTALSLILILILYRVFENKYGKALGVGAPSIV